MNLEIVKKENSILQDDNINVVIEYSKNSAEAEKIEKYLGKYYNEKNTIVAKINNIFVSILKNDIIVFFSDKKMNYCRTATKKYEIKSKLYEIEKLDNNFVRISKSCIVNVDHVKCFDLSQTGKIIIRFDDKTYEYVSRRKVRDVLEYLDGRRKNEK